MLILQKTAIRQIARDNHRDLCAPTAKQVVSCFDISKLSVCIFKVFKNVYPSSLITLFTN